MFQWLRIQLIVSRLNDPDIGIREKALESLGRYPTPQVARLLVEALLKPFGSKNAVSSLRTLGPVAVPYLVAAIASDANGAAAISRCIDVLVEISAADAVGPLMELFRSRGAVRSTAATALAKLADPRSVQFLANAWKSRVENKDNKHVIAMIATALHKCGWKPAETTERVEFAVVLGRYADVVAEGKDSLPLLVQEMRNKNSEAARALLELSKADLVDMEILREIVQLPDVTEEVGFPDENWNHFEYRTELVCSLSDVRGQAQTEIERRQAATKKRPT